MATPATTHTRTEALLKVTLYSNHLSSCAWRVRLALLFKGIPYEYKAVDLSKGEQFSEEFTKLNPLQMVPVLAIDGVTLVDSIAIILVVNLISAYVQPLQMGGHLAKLKAKLGEEEQQNWIQGLFMKGFIALEQILQKTAGKYCFGDMVTLADLVLVPQLGNATRFKVDLAPYPTVRRVGQALNELPEVKASVPANQPDAPKS